MGHANESIDIWRIISEASEQIPEEDLALLPPSLQERYLVKRIPGDGRTTYEISHKIGPEWKVENEVLLNPDDPSWKAQRPFEYNPDIVENLEVEEDKWGVTKKPALKQGWSLGITQNDNYMYRGMSWEEYQNILSTRVIRSNGSYNLGDEQVGLTYFSSDADQARFYAHSFAPIQFGAAIGKPAIVIAVPKMEGVRVGGTGESEIGIPGELSADLIEEVWAGEVFQTKGKGMIDIIDSWPSRTQGSRANPMSWIAWHKI